MKAELAKRQFATFLTYVFIQEPRPNGGHSIIPFELWEHLLEVVEDLKGNPLIVWPKARQIGASWLLAAYSLWKTGYNNGFKTLVFSQGEGEAYEFLSKVEFIRLHLPEWLQPRRINDSKKILEFGPGWYIQAFPSTPKAGHGVTAGLVIFDEAEFHDYLDEAYVAAKPTTADVGGQMIFASKCSPYDPQSLFKKLCRGAPDNGFKCIFHPWNVRENRTPEWFRHESQSYPDPFVFQKAYPGTLKEALAAPESMQVIGEDLYEALKKETRDPIWQEGAIKIFYNLVPGHRYTAASDTAHGLGLDNSVTVVLDVSIGQIVGSVWSNVIAPLDFALDSIHLLRKFDFPVWAIEDNEWGIRVIDRAQALSYPRIFYRKQNEPGFHTGVHSRPIMWSDYIDALRARTIILSDVEAVEELPNLIRDPNKKGRIAAADGSHDDYSTALAIALTITSSAVRAEQSRDSMNEFIQIRRKGKWSCH